MALKILWTHQAEHGLLKVIDYLEENWTVKEILKLERKLQEVLQLISKNPDLFPASNHAQKIYKALVDKNNYIIYRIDSTGKYIEIINFRGTKEKPL